MQLNEFMYDKTLIDVLTIVDLQLRLRYIFMYTRPILGSKIMYYSTLIFLPIFYLTVVMFSMTLIVPSLVESVMLIYTTEASIEQKLMTSLIVVIVVYCNI